MSESFPEQNRASAVLAKIGHGTADADFARAMREVLDAAQVTGKKAKLILTVEVDPRSDLGCVELRAEVRTRLPKLPPPASQMHLGPKGELLTQMEWMMGGGPSEAPKSLAITAGLATAAAAAPAAQPSLAVAASMPAPPLAPLAADHQPRPVYGKEAGAGKEH
jgi:hypothetical protein